MPIPLCCPSCQARLTAPDKAIGRMLPCPACKTKLFVAPPEKSSPPAAVRDEVAVKPSPTELGPKDFENLQDEATELGPEDFEDFDQEPAAKETEDEDFDCEVLDEPEEDEEVVEVLPAEEVMEVLPAEDEEDDPAQRSRLLSLPKIFIKGDKGFDVVGQCGWTLINPQSRKRVGRAVEVQEGAATAARMLLGVGRTLMPSTLEVTEGRDEQFVLSVRRPTRVGSACLEVFDADDRLLGSVEQNLWNILKGDPCWVRDTRERKYMRITEPKRGRWAFHTADGKMAGEFVRESVYLNKIKIYLLPKGGSYYMLFQPCLADRPRDKMLILGIGLGMDLYRSGG